MMYDLEKLHNDIILKYNEVFFKTNNLDWAIFMNDGFMPLDSDGYPTTSNFPKLEGVHLMWKYQCYLYTELLNQSNLDLSQPLGNLLDIGCGRGGGCSVYEKYFNFDYVVGVDLNPNQIEFCKRVHSNIQFDQGSAMMLPYDADSFNIVTNVESGNYYVDYEKFVIGLNKIIKVGGLFLCADTGGQERVDFINDIYPKFGFKVIKHTNITKNVAASCSIEKYRMLQHDKLLADVMMYDEERYFLYRRNPNVKHEDYHIFVIEKQETI
jgi:SAM-dependent methyltransferase